MTEGTRITETFNSYGTPVTMFRCQGCRSAFTVCPAVAPENDDQWTGCLGLGCLTYDETRDADKLFDEGRVRRVGDRSALCVIEGSK